MIVAIENINETQETYHIITERFNNYFVSSAIEGHSE